MTRGKIIYLDSDQKAYSTIEFNGDMYPEGHGDEIIERFEENYFTSFTVYENFVFRFNKRNFGYPEKLIRSLSCSQTGIIDVTGNWTDYLYIINESTQKWIILDEEGTKDLPDQTLGVVSFKSVENVIQKKSESVSDQTSVVLHRSEEPAFVSESAPFRKAVSNNPAIGTPYDDAYRTLLNDCERLIIPVINEVFGKDYRGDERIIHHPDIHFINRQDGTEEKRITDSIFTISSKTDEKYLMECQSYGDSSLLVRIFEYITQEAIDSSEMSGSVLKVTIPHAGVLFLRSTGKTPDQMNIFIVTPGGNCSFDIPVMKIQSYSIDQIVKRKLYFLLPFYIFNHEKYFSEYEKDEKSRSSLQGEYIRIMELLDQAVKEKEISYYYRRTIIDMMKKVLDNIARNYENVKEEVKKIVGGEILEHEGKTIYNEGKEEGHIEGKADGEALVSKLMSILFKENKIEDAKKAAEDSNYLHLLLKQYNIE